MHRRQYLPHSGSKVSRRYAAQQNKHLREEMERKETEAANERARIIADAEVRLNAGFLGFLRRVWRALTTPISMKGMS